MAQRRQRARALAKRVTQALQIGAGAQVAQTRHSDGTRRRGKRACVARHMAGHYTARPTPDPCRVTAAAASFEMPDPTSATPAPLPEPAPQPAPGPDAVAAQRWLSRPRPRSPWLHEEVARRMVERLDWIKQQPVRWTHWDALLGGLEGHRLVQARYPSAQAQLAGAGVEAARNALRATDPHRWTPWRRARLTVGDEPADMLWANLALHHASDPRAVLSGWLDRLTVDGFVMFSTLGPDSLQELRALWRRHGWGEPTHELTDMHDWGDRLVQAGFAEPVMDMERLTLTYSSAEALLGDLRDWGRNLHPARCPALRTRGWRQRMVQALEDGLPRDEQGRLSLTLELVYGHAHRPRPRAPVQAETRLSAQQMREMLGRRR